LTGRRLFCGLAALWLSGVLLLAHPMTIKGVVVAVEKTRIEVAPLDDAGGKPGKPEWHAIGPRTKILRGKKAVRFAEAGIAVDERVVLLVDHGSDGKLTVIEVRLAAR